MMHRPAVDSTAPPASLAFHKLDSISVWYGVQCQMMAGRARCGSGKSKGAGKVNRFTGPLVVAALISFASAAPAAIITLSQYSSDVSNAVSFALFLTDTDKLRFVCYKANSTASWIDITGTTTVTEGQHHFAAVRSGSNFYLWLDGNQEGTGSGSEAVTDSPHLMRVSAVSIATGLDWYWNGYLSQVRVQNGTAQYTSAFNPWDLTIVDTANTVLFLEFADGHGSTSFTDSSSHNHTITAHGDALRPSGLG